ncbi:T9SS type A sorting domain-containing protein [Pedobacter glucosidilyticus]|uniref:T9SS type A sorting domain-containing protein n=1 Tax=Pedobacter glucosidilyticus TaxID=1122941 RepID=UPI00138AC679|nr:T9SS type A sorting domain-containing protein [Pedobacter glucosidilyticus]
MKLINLTLFIVLIFSSFLQAQNNSNYIGINMGSAHDYSEDRAFTDVFRIARPWYKIGTNYTVKADVDNYGWPTEDAELYVWHGLENMEGTYKLRFNGTAVISGGNIVNQVYNPTTNTTTADVVVTYSYFLRLRFTETNNGIKNVQMMRPIAPHSTQSYDFSTSFTNEIKNIMAKVKCVRFLGFTATNGDTLTTTWSQRVPDDYYWGSLNTEGYGWEGRGTSWETMIAFCNEMNVDAWINIPILADDNYVASLADLWHQNLNPNLKLYIEYSNEVWNTASAFSQSHKNHDLAKKEVASGNSSLNFDNTNNTWYWAWRRIAKRTVEISNIFRTVCGDASMMTRIRPVLMWQQGNAQSTAEEMLTWLDHYANTQNKPIQYYLYGGGGSAYYNPDNNDPNLTLNNIWTSKSFDVNHWMIAQTKDANYVAAMGLKRVAYEGGPSLDRSIPLNAAVETVKEQANHDPRMTDLIVAHHEVWSNVGGDLLCYFQTTGDSQWGFTQNVYDLNTPKYRALDIINNTPKAAITIGNKPPFNIDGKNFNLSKPSWLSPGTGTQRLEQQNWLGYLIHIEADGNYAIKINYSWANNAVLKFSIDGNSMISNPQSISGQNQISLPYHVYLNKGLHLVRVMADIGNFDVNTILIEPDEVLPVNIISFYGNKTFKGNALNWRVVENENNNYYEVLKSTDGKTFYGLTQIKPLKNHQKEVVYNYLDIEHKPAYYQIKQIDFDGQFIVSNIIFIDENLNHEAVYPNPTKDILNVTLNNFSNQIKQIIITDITGKIVLEQFAHHDIGKTQINVATLPEGIYILNIMQQDGKQILKQKFIKSK